MVGANLFLLANGFLLGLRHGVDWDHIAAILDIVSSADIDKSESKLFKLTRDPLVLTLAYAVGHGLVVVMLGIAAVYFYSSLPPWIDPIMERIVGITLLILGTWVFYSLLLHIRGKQSFQLTSRWMLILQFIKYLKSFLFDTANLNKSKKLLVKQYGLTTAFSVGALHGIGAETGTQVLLLTALGAAAHTAAIVMLVFFLIGMITANTMVALMTLIGLTPASNVKSVYLTSGALVGVFSIIIGSVFILGQSNHLPDLKKLLGA